jgi:hypothetical protein
MKPGRLFSIALSALMLNLLLSGAAFALFGFGGSDTGKSGLDFTKGYDVNTVTTLSGRATTAPQTGEKGEVFVEIGNRDGKFSLYLGPGSFWEKNGIPISPNDDLSAKGSIAQGKDGKVYLLTQKLSNRSTGAKLELRDDKGAPAWSGRHGERESGGRMHHDGGMRGGGGMMRH